jgi:hypothetical protein
MHLPCFDFENTRWTQRASEIELLLYPFCGSGFCLTEQGRQCPRPRHRESADFPLTSQQVEFAQHGWFRERLIEAI